MASELRVSARRARLEGRHFDVCRLCANGSPSVLYCRRWGESCADRRGGLMTGKILGV
jgi:hypothetical protein